MSKSVQFKLFQVLLNMSKIIVWSRIIPWDKHLERYVKLNTFNVIVTSEHATCSEDIHLQRTLQSASRLQQASAGFYVFLLNINAEATERLREKIRTSPVVNTLAFNEMCSVSIALQSHEYSIENSLCRSASNWKYGVNNNDVIGRFVSQLNNKRCSLHLPDEKFVMVRYMEFQDLSRVGPDFPLQETRWSYSRLLTTGILLCLSIIGCVAGIPMLIHAGIRYSRDREIEKLIECSEKMLVTDREAEPSTMRTQVEQNDRPYQDLGWGFTLKHEPLSQSLQPEPNTEQTFQR